MSGDLYDVSIVYSPRDVSIASAVAARLRADGVNVRLHDPAATPPGDLTSLEQSRTMILCMSANAFASDWSRLEPLTVPFRDPSNPACRFVPLRIDGSAIPRPMAQFVPVDWQAESGGPDYRKLLDACRAPAAQARNTPSPNEVPSRAFSLGHTGAIRSVAFSPDGTLALSGADDKTVRVWDVETGRALRVLEGHSDSVFSVAWSPDGGRALSGALDKTVRVWDVETGRALRVLEGHSASVWSVAWSPDGGRALSGSADNTVRVWDVETGRALRVLEGHSARVWSVAWSPDGGRALSGSEDNTVRVWDVETGRALRVLEGHSARVLSVAWSPDGGRALSGSDDKTVRVWDVETGRALRVLEGHSARVLSVAWSPDGGRALSGALDQTVRVWDVETGRALRVLEGHSDSVRSVAWSPDGGRALSGALDHTVRVWDVETGRALRVLEGHSDSVRSVAWSPDGRRAFSGADDNTVRVWEVETGRALRVLEGHSAGINSVAWSPDGGRALSGSDDKTVRVWDVETGRALRVLEGHSDSVRSVAWSPDGGRALSGAYDNTVRVWEVETGRALRVLEGHSAGINSVAWSPDGGRALSGADDNTVRVWDVETGRALRVLEGHSDSVRSVAWSPDGGRALSGALDKTVRVWDVETGRALRVLEGHSDSVRSVAWSPDGGRALSGAYDNTVRVWEVETGRALRVLEGHSDSVRSVAWSPDGRRAFSGSANAVMRIWDLEDSGTKPNAGVADDESRRPLQSEMQYANAKILLVGDTGVGKSGLAERLVNKRFQPTKSTHARRASVLENRLVTEEGGVEVAREILLWDLAGQPYRLVHQLSMEDAAVACVLFDSRGETNPFEGAAFWSKVLDQARTNTKLKKLLVASRMDVGGLPAGKERIEEFRRENGFDRFIPTSATTGEGCEELAVAIRDGVAWRDMPRITTPASLAALREYVSHLKGKRDVGEATAAVARLLTIGELHEGFSAWFGEKTPPDAFATQLERLEATDDLDLLIFRSTDAKPRADHRVLLDPTRVDSYASALLVAAKDEPDGPGHLLESRVREGTFKLDPEERIPDRESERHVLWHVIESLISRDLAIREPIKGEDYLVFPSQCTAELRFPGKMVFGVAFGFSGAIRSVYATLVAQLAHYEGFKKREFFSDAALYSPSEGGRCLIRLVDRGRGDGELEVSFESETPPNIRQGFLEFVRKHVTARSLPGSLTERHAFHCQNPDCRQPFDDKVVRARLQSRKKFLLCPYCEKKTPLLNLLASPTPAAASVTERMDTDARVGRQRMTAELVIAAKEAEGTFDVFLSHNSKDKASVEKIARQLMKKGIRPWLDKWDLAPGDTVMDALERAVNLIPCAALFFGPADVGRWHIIEIRAYMERWAGKEARLIPVILPGVDESPDLPMFVRQTLWVDMRDWENDESDAFYRLVCGILGKPPGDSPKKSFGVRDVAQWQQKGRRAPR